MLAVLPVVVTFPGDLVIVQLPLGNPLKTTLPVETAQVGCVMAPTTGALGKALTVKLLVDEQPVAVSVKVNVTTPALTPVTKPAFVIVAIAVLLLVQVPPVFGVTFAVLPTQTTVAPPSVGLAGMALISTFAEATEVQLFELVTVKV